MLSGDPATAAVGTVAGMAATATNLGVSSPYQKRWDSLAEGILRQLATLEEHLQHSLTEHDLLREEVLTVSAIVRSQVEASDDAKLQYLANAFVNVVADKTLTHDVIATLMGVAADLTATHIRVLELLCDPEGGRNEREIRSSQY